MAQERRDEVERCRQEIQRRCGVWCRCADDVWRVYERLVEDWRRYDAILWQLPFGTMTAVGVILTLAFYYIPSSEYGVRVALFFALAWFTFVMMHVSYKVRHFQIVRSACAEAIEQLCTGFAVPYETGEARGLLNEEIGAKPTRTVRATVRARVLQGKVLSPHILDVHRLNSHASLPHAY
jgi:hypothetical protein